MTIPLCHTVRKLETLLTTKETVWSDYFTQELLDVFCFHWVDDEWKCRSNTIQHFMLYPIMGFVTLPYFDDLVKAMRKIIIEVKIPDVGVSE